MMLAPLIPLVLALMIILLQKVDFRIAYTNGLSVEISFTIFSLSFYDSEESRLPLLKSLKTARNIPILFRSLRFLLRHSAVNVLNISHNETDTVAGTVFRTIPFLISTSAIIAYISTNAANFSMKQHNNFDKNELSFDILFKTRAANLIISAMLFLYYILKRKIRRVIRNV